MLLRKDYVILLTVLGFAYTLFYSWLLTAGGGVPYVMDNNESFSSFWHTYNFFHFDLLKSAGLADESFAYHAAAHPYVHTHQGNFPRLYNFLIYALGAHTIESQIAVTTFTVGAAAIFMAYHFFCKIANPLFALVCCLLLITDYVLVAQWQVVTYRVWHEFFVFSSMLCVHRMVEGRRFWALTTLINFACLFYFEFIFVAFVSMGSAFYAAFICRHAPKKILGFWMVQAGGGVLALSILASQLILYMGWDAAKMDAYLTFFARNQYQDSAVLLERVREFFDFQNIVFWYNLVDGSRFRTPQHFFASLLYFEFQVHTPFLSTLCGVGVLALFAKLFFKASAAINNAELGKVLSNARLLIWTVPVGAALGLSLLHFLYKRLTNDMAPLFGAEFVVIAATVIFSLLFVQFSPKFRGANRLVLLRNLANQLALTILIFNVPGILARLSYGWLEGARHSISFAGYSAIFFCFFAWIVLTILLGTHLQRGIQSNHFIARAAINMLSFFAFLVLFISLFGKDLILGVPGEAKQWLLPASLTYFGIAFVTAGLASAMLRRVCQVFFAEDVSPSGISLSGFAAMVKVSVFILLVAFFISWSWALYNPRYGPLWQEVAEMALPGPLPQLVTILIVMLAAASIISKKMVFNELGIGPVIKGCAAFLITGMCAYAVVYLLSPGYVFTGYRFRQAPFTVFHTVVVLALFFYVLLVVVLKYLSPKSLRMTAVVTSLLGSTAMVPGHGRIGARTIAGIVSLTALGFLTIYWAGVQFSYIKLMPPDHFSFLKKLSQNPYLGQTFVVNTYAAPIAAKTGSWAYMNAEFKSPKLIKSGDRYIVPFDTTYLWFADKRTNVEYAKPSYFLCVTSQSTSTIIEEVRRRIGLGEGNVGCEGNQLVQLARRGEGKSVYPALEFMESDEDGPKVVGYERWAIVRLNWAK
jgi:hypothetical protein